MTTDSLTTPHENYTPAKRRMAFGFAVASLVVGLHHANTANAIVGGNETTTDSYQHYVEVRSRQTDGTSNSCGGSVIAPSVVLTAAHCVDNVGNDPSRIITTLHQSLSPSPIAMKIHPLWNGDVHDGHDLAILTLPPFTTSHITPVAVGAPFDHSAFAPRRDAWTVGKGRTSQNTPTDGKLRELHTVLRSNSDMRSAYDKWYWFDPWKDRFHLGAGFTNHTICDGDSGGPLTIDREGVITQVGVASFTEATWTRCDEPGGFARLDGPQLAWVASQVPSIQDGWDRCDGGVPRQAGYKLTTTGHRWEADGSSWIWWIGCGYPPPPHTLPPPNNRPPADEPPSECPPGHRNCQPK